MKIKILIIFIGFLAGATLGFFITNYSLITRGSSCRIEIPLINKKTVIGFLPYWLLENAEQDYSKYITTLSYFGLRIDGEGNIQKFLNPQEKEPGWYALESGKAESFLNRALKNNVALSLVLVSGSNNAINELISDPIAHAKNLNADLKPLIEKYKFSDINIDIESTQNASDSARANFAKFVKAVKQELKNNETLTVEISADDVINKKLIDPRRIGKTADNVVLMAYDFHYMGSFVTGPVAPLAGAGITSEYDVNAATEKLLEMIPAKKLILGIPIYGYEWESIGKDPRSAIIPNTGLTASNRRAEALSGSCPKCITKLDIEAEENYISYLDDETGAYHTIFYPNENSTLKKVRFADSFRLAGVALWALGYEGNSILKPLINYKN